MEQGAEEFEYFETVFQRSRQRQKGKETNDEQKPYDESDPQEPYYDTDSEDFDANGTAFAERDCGKAGPLSCVVLHACIPE